MGIELVNRDLGAIILPSLSQSKPGNWGYCDVCGRQRVRTISGWFTCPESCERLYRVLIKPDLWEAGFPLAVREINDDGKPKRGGGYWFDGMNENAEIITGVYLPRRIRDAKSWKAASKILRDTDRRGMTVAVIRTARTATLHAFELKP